MAKGLCEVEGVEEKAGPAQAESGGEAGRFHGPSDALDDCEVDQFRPTIRIAELVRNGVGDIDVR